MLFSIASLIKVVALSPLVPCPIYNGSFSCRRPHEKYVIYCIVSSSTAWLGSPRKKPAAAAREGGSIRAVPIRRNEHGARVLTSTCETTFTRDALSLFRSAIASRTIQILRFHSLLQPRYHTLGVGAFHKSLPLQASIIRVDLIQPRYNIYSRWLATLYSDLYRRRKNTKCFSFFHIQKRCIE